MSTRSSRQPCGMNNPKCMAVDSMRAPAHDGCRPPGDVMNHHVRQVVDLHQAVVMRFGRGRHCGAYDHVVIGHETQHLNAVLVDCDEAAPRLRQGEVQLSSLLEEFGEFFGWISGPSRN